MSSNVTDLIVQPPPVGDLSADVALVASNAVEMQLAQQQLVAWFAAKLKSLEADRTELELEIEIAMRNDWRTTALRRQLNLAAKRVQFYDKCRRAAEAGYCLIPNMPCDVFAVRTEKQRPDRQHSRWESELGHVRSESPPVDAGHYVDAQAAIGWSHNVTEKSSGGTERVVRIFETTDFDAVDFPVSICKPQVMQATAQAMAMKVFDEIAVVDDGLSHGSVASRRRGRRRKGDPLVLGIVRDPRRVQQDDRRITFLISWFVDTREL